MTDMFQVNAYPSVRTCISVGPKDTVMVLIRDGDFVRMRLPYISAELFLSYEDAKNLHDVLQTMLDDMAEWRASHEVKE